MTSFVHKAQSVTNVAQPHGPLYLYLVNCTSKNGDDNTSSEEEQVGRAVVVEEDTTEVPTVPTDLWKKSYDESDVPNDYHNGDDHSLVLLQN